MHPVTILTPVAIAWTQVYYERRLQVSGVHCTDRESWRMLAHDLFGMQNSLLLRLHETI